MKFSSLSHLGIWNNIKEEYSEIVNQAMRTLISFATSYLCEVGFSKVSVLKSKYLPKLNVEKEK